MGRNIRFPLKMANGTEARDLDEFTKNFDLGSALGYYEDGKLLKWLKSHYYDIEADKLEALDKTAKSFTSDFCAIFGIELPEDSGSGADIEYIARRNEKKRILRTITDDESVIYNVDSVALDQDDLLDIFDEKKKEIYLCQGEFEIPLSVTGVTYHGIADPVVTVRVTDNVNFNEKNIRFIDCVYGWDVSKTSPLDNMKRAEHLFLKGDHQKSAGILETYAEQGNPRAVMLLCHIYKELLPDNDKLKKWSEKAKQSCEVCNVIDNFGGSEKYKPLLKKLADKGDSQYKKYYEGSADAVKSSAENNNTSAISSNDEINTDDIETIQRLAEDGNAEAQYKLGNYYYGKIKEAAELHITNGSYPDNAIKWYTKAAEQKHPAAQYRLGCCYLEGIPQYQDNDKGKMWLKNAALEGYYEAQLVLGDLFYEGKYIPYESYNEKDYIPVGFYDYDEDISNRVNSYYSERVPSIENWSLADREAALKWYNRAAKQNSIKALVRLGDMYYCGDDIEDGYDEDKALKYYEKAAELGCIGAQIACGKYYQFDDNMYGDCNDEALKWYEMADKLGSYEAKELLTDLRDIMEDEDDDD